MQIYWKLFIESSKKQIKSTKWWYLCGFFRFFALMWHYYVNMWRYRFSLHSNSRFWYLRVALECSRSRNRRYAIPIQSIPRFVAIRCAHCCRLRYYLGREDKALLLHKQFFRQNYSQKLFYGQGEICFCGLWAKRCRRDIARCNPQCG